MLQRQQHLPAVSFLLSIYVCVPRDLVGTARVISRLICVKRLAYPHLLVPGKNDDLSATLCVVKDFHRAHRDC
uniref:Putative secreted peptide n=1 Tax=Anopheles braziliensis TaxID=58242 RepID=A0A2M3ZWW0_9DIPT